MQHGGEDGRTWALFMTAGGHFAGAIVRVKRPDVDDDDGGLTKKGKPKRPKPEVEVLKHKTFHRYTSTSRPLFHIRCGVHPFGSPSQTGRCTGFER